MRRLVDRFAGAAARCTALEQLHALMDEASQELGFHYFALLHHASLRSGGGAYLRIDNYPADWVEHLVREQGHLEDPVHLASRRLNTGFCWCELGRIVSLDPRQRAILELSRKFGLGAGFTVPANVPGEPHGSCSFAVRRGAKLPRRRLLCAELVGGHAFRAARRINGLPEPPARPHLSRREVECVRLVARGKTDWEIGAILGLGVETARQYVKRARAAYDVVSRTQLVVHGLLDEWVSFDEAIDSPAGARRRCD